MRPRLGRAVVISLCLVSCAAKSAPTRITVKVADGYSGSFRLSPCVDNAQDPVLVDEKGNGKTSACPMEGDVEIVVLRGGNTIYLHGEQIKIARAGDGFPVTISAAIP
ncbi:MAG: hypothetical protein ABSF40_14270 [Candidatus Acidiferrales bacterium]|jgi:hypothetical protein